MAEYDYPGLTVTTHGQVATIGIQPLETLGPEITSRTDLHWELGQAFSALRGDNTIRVIVLTGAQDGSFLVPPRTAVYADPAGREQRNDPARLWKVFTGIVRCHEVMAAIEKPIVARVNGDAIGFGQSLMFASDLIVAREDARIVDMHLGMGEVEPYGPPYGIVPGDGGAALAPLYMTPARAKEYLMLARAYTAAELARLGIINYAVPASELDGVVDDLVRRLLQRSPYALAWTKRVANRHVAQQLNMALDAGAAYELTTFHQIEKLGWADKTTLT
jgi:enoyl-CoA hydratase/carnithine racemase